jgi:hypothetical protein
MTGSGAATKAGRAVPGVVEGAPELPPPAVTAPNVAVQARAALIVTVAVVAVPVQLPDQPVKLEPAAGVAVNVTSVKVDPVMLAMLAVQVPGQLMPPVDEVTRPVPVPAVVTVSP